MIRTIRLALPAALALTVGAASLSYSSPVLAYDATSTASTNVENGVILRGYDAVAYFTTGKPTVGSPKYSATYQGATYHFASAANQKRFLANPAAYAPQYGGFCAMGAALGKKLDVDPTQFKVVDSKLYLNVNADVFKKWSANPAEHIDAANQNWPAIKDKAPDAL